DWAACPPFPSPAPAVGAALSVERRWDDNRGADRGGPGHGGGTSPQQFGRRDGTPELGHGWLASTTSLRMYRVTAGLSSLHALWDYRHEQELIGPVMLTFAWY